MNVNFSINMSIGLMLESLVVFDIHGHIVCIHITLRTINPCIKSQNKNVNILTSNSILKLD